MSNHASCDHRCYTSLGADHFDDLIIQEHCFNCDANYLPEMKIVAKQFTDLLLLLLFFLLFCWFTFLLT